MYTITNENDQIGLNAVIHSGMIIGVVDKDNNRTCVMRTHFYNTVYKRFELGKYVLLPFITNTKIYNENRDNNSSCNIESGDIKDIISIDGVLSGKGLKPVKAFDTWKQAYEWILGIEEVDNN